MHEVFDGIALGQEVGVGSHVKLHFALDAACLQFLVDDVFELLRGAYGRGGLEHEHRVVVQVAGKGAGNVDHRLEVGAAVAVELGVDGAKHHIGIVEGPLVVSLKGEAIGVDVACDHGLEAWLIDGDVAIHETVDFLAVGVDAFHVHAQLGKASPGHKT